MSKIELSLLDGSQGQVDFYLDMKSKFPAFVAGYGSGKTYIGIMKILMLAGYNFKKSKGKPWTYVICEPTYPHIHKIIFPCLFDTILDPLGVEYTHYKSSVHPRVFIPHLNATFGFFSCHEPVKLIGSEAAGALVDETHVIPRQSWTNIIRRVRSKAPLLQIMATFTPDTYGWTRDAWGREELEGKPNDKGYKVYHAETSSNLYTDDDYVDTVSNDCAEGELDAVIGGRFITTQGGRVYHTFSQKDNVGSIAQYDPTLELSFAFDFNPGAVGVSCAICQQNGPYYFIVDELSDSSLSLEQACGELLKRYQVRQTAPITIYGDASGTRSTSEQKEYNIIQNILNSDGYCDESYHPPFRPDVELRTAISNPSIADRCSIVRTTLCNGNGHRTLFVNPTCTKLIKDLNQVEYKAFYKKQRNKVHTGNWWELSSGSDGTLTHMSDAMGYWLYRVRPDRNSFIRDTEWRMK